MSLQCPAVNRLCHSYPISMVMLIPRPDANFLMVSLETSLPRSTRAIVGRDMPDRWANSNCDHPRRRRQQPLPHRSHRDWWTFPSLLTSLTNGVPIGFLLMILRMQRFGANVSDLFEYLRIRNVFSDFLSFSKRLIDSKPNGIREIFR